MWGRDTFPGPLLLPLSVAGVGTVSGNILLLVSQLKHRFSVFSGGGNVLFYIMSRLNYNLDGVGPVDNRPSTKELHNLAIL